MRSFFGFEDRSVEYALKVDTTMPCGYTIANNCGSLQRFDCYILSYFLIHLGVKYGELIRSKDTAFEVDGHRAFVLDGLKTF
ncbi:hypothetical protein DPMN_180357 [Dreissena polymorpha]|uniref:Uncharacterized protein n=1 Tax=Dreissena polymorpha TaxID=45954 RepID=A0A9D4ILK5_DREPO|nr:hypothetical protein DPMN_180357 [Dreissena polymorpha]